MAAGMVKSRVRGSSGFEARCFVTAQIVEATRTSVQAGTRKCGICNNADNDGPQSCTSRWQNQQSAGSPLRDFQNGKEYFLVNILLKAVIVLLVC